MFYDNVVNFVRYLDAIKETMKHNNVKGFKIIDLNIMPSRLPKLTLGHFLCLSIIPECSLKITYRQRVVLFSVLTSGEAGL